MEPLAKEIKQRIFRPPSVPEALWNVVPSDQQQEVLSYLADQLRAGLHPKIALKAFLKNAGLVEEAPAISIRPQPLKPVVMNRSKPSAAQPATVGIAAEKASGGFKLKVQAKQPDSDDFGGFDFDDEPEVSDLPNFSEPTPEERRSPIIPFGLRNQPETADVPIGHIGHALHRLLGFSGEPDARAAKLEASILRAISLDPEYVLAEPEGLGNLGCEVPIHIISSIRDLIIDEAKLVISDILMRKENDDPTVSEWHDADDYLDND